MEASGNEYAQQLLDRAASLIQASGDGQDTDRTEHEQWLREYHQEKARFGQPVGSPGYARATVDARVDAADAVDDTGNAGLPGVNTARRRLSDARLSGPGGVDGEGNPVPATEQQTQASGDDTEDHGGEYGDMTVPQLTALAKERGIPSSGTKPELIARLEDNDASRTGAAHPGS